MSDSLRRWLPVLIIAAALIGVWLGATLFAALT